MKMKRILRQVRSYCIVDAITGRYHNPTQVDRDKGSREWFKNGANHLPGNQSKRDTV